MRNATRLVVLVHGKWACGDAVVPQQHCGHAGVLGGDDVRAPEHVERAQRHIAQVTERRRDHI